MKNYNSFIVDKKIRDIVTETLNEGFFQNIGKLIIYKLKKIFKGARQAWIEYNIWVQKKGYNKNSAGLVYAEIYPDGKPIVADADPKYKEMIEKEIERLDKVEKELKQSPYKEGDFHKMVKDNVEKETGELLKDEVETEDGLQQVQEGMEHPLPNKVPSATHGELYNILLTRYRTHLLNPGKMLGTMIWGAPAVGKSAAVKKFCKDRGILMQMWNLATCEPCDFIGVPDTDVKEGGKQKRTINRPPMVFPDEDDKVGGILFLDEINRANTSVLGAALTLVQQGKAGMYTLPPTWQIIAAGNRKCDVSTVTKLDMTLSRRFGHINLMLTTKEWIAWALKQPWVYAGVVAFLERYPEYIHKPEEETGVEGHHAWPNPESWENLCILLTEEEKRSQKETGRYLGIKEIQEIAAVEIGFKDANLFADFIKIKDKFTTEDMENVYNNPKKAPPIPKENYQVTATFIVLFKKGQELTEKQIDNFFEYTLSIKQSEIATMMLAYFLKIHRYINKKYKMKVVDMVEKWHAKHHAEPELGLKEDEFAEE